MADAIIERTGARILLFAQDRILLARQHDPARPQAPGYWVVPGGGVDAGESLAQAAVREVLEETGIRLDASALGPLIARDVAVFDFEGRTYRQHNHFFRATVSMRAPDRQGWTELERRAMTDIVWHDIATLDGLPEPVYPRSLPGLAATLRTYDGDAPLWLGDAGLATPA